MCIRHIYNNYFNNIGGGIVYQPQTKGMKEFELLFSQLKPLNKNYALGVLRSLHYAQEQSSQESKSDDKEDKKGDEISPT